MSCDSELAGRLYEISGPILRRRIATELMAIPPCNTEDLEQCVLALPEAQKYIEYYAEGPRQMDSYCYSKMLHGGVPEKLENTAGKLWALGIKKGVAALDKYLQYYISIMERDFYRRDTDRIGYGIYYIAQFLSLLGYAAEDAVAPILQIRLNQIYDFIKQGRYDIYVPLNGYPKLPSAWKGVDRIIEPTLTKYRDAEGEPPMPSLYDLLGMVGQKQTGMSKENETKANAILQYCFSEHYQKGIMHGYGIVLAPSKRYYSMGWSVHFPGYGQTLDSGMEINKLILWADLLSNFEVAGKFPIFIDLLEFLENYKTKDGFYRFPVKYIPEEKKGYFVSGKYMGLGENRKQKDTCLIESTFWVLSIKKKLGMFLQ